MKLFGLTGGIACGKSTVASELAATHGCRVVDCDAIVRRLQQAGSPCVRAIAVAFSGENVVDPKTGELRREVLSAIVFSDPVKRRRLAKVMNGPVFRAIFWELCRAWWSTPWDGVVVLDAPLLFETGVFTIFCSGVICVGTTNELQIDRLRSRNGLSRDEALQRVNAQMPVDEKMRRSDFRIVNQSSIEELKESIARSAHWMKNQTTLYTGWNKMMYGTLITVGVIAWSAYSWLRPAAW